MRWVVRRRKIANMASSCKCLMYKSRVKMSLWKVETQYKGEQGACWPGGGRGEGYLGAISV